MTEEEWLTCDDARAMLRAVASGASDRKKRLFAVACCRHLGRLPTVPEFTEALEASEHHADVKPNKAALRRARQAVRSVRPKTWDGRRSRENWSALWLAEQAATEKISWLVASEIDGFVARDMLPEANRPPVPALARCIFGNPFRVPGFRAEGLSPNVLDLARSIDRDRAFDRLTILGDALEEAGCVDESILSHCREPGVHAKGCWVLDLILGK
jgi:hypothetical protein